MSTVSSVNSPREYQTPTFAKKKIIKIIIINKIIIIKK